MVIVLEGIVCPKASNESTCVHSAQYTMKVFSTQCTFASTADCVFGWLCHLTAGVNFQRRKSDCLGCVVLLCLVVCSASLITCTSHPRQLIFLWKSDCLGCVVLLCLVICMTLLASFFLYSAHTIMYINTYTSYTHTPTHTLS